MRRAQSRRYLESDAFDPSDTIERENGRSGTARRGLRIAVHLLCESSPNEGRTITVRRQRPTPEQVVRRLREGERMLNADKDLAEILRHLGIARSAWKHAGGTSTAG